MAMDAKTNNVCVDACGLSKAFSKDSTRNDLLTTLAGLSLDHLTVLLHLVFSLVTLLGLSHITWLRRHLLGMNFILGPDCSFHTCHVTCICTFSV